MPATLRSAADIRRDMLVRHSLGAIGSQRPSTSPLNLRAETSHGYNLEMGDRGEGQGAAAGMKHLLRQFKGGQAATTVPGGSGLNVQEQGPL